MYTGNGCKKLLKDLSTQEIGIAKLSGFSEWFSNNCITSEEPDGDVDVDMQYAGADPQWHRGGQLPPPGFSKIVLKICFLNLCPSLEIFLPLPGRFRVKFSVKIEINLLNFDW